MTADINTSDDDFEGSEIEDDLEAIAEAEEAERIVAELSSDPDFISTKKQVSAAGVWFYCTRCDEPSLCRAKCRPDIKDRIPLKSTNEKDAVLEIKNNGWSLPFIFNCP
jgi:hypothetical protein